MEQPTNLSLMERAPTLSAVLLLIRIMRIPFGWEQEKTTTSVLLTTVMASINRSMEAKVGNIWASKNQNTSQKSSSIREIRMSSTSLLMVLFGLTGATEAS